MGEQEADGYNYRNWQKKTPIGVSRRTREAAQKQLNEATESSKPSGHEHMTK